jgi:hypothetical protein
MKVIQSGLRRKKLNNSYCKECGSCGEPDCCPPEKCKYWDSNQRAYKELSDDYFQAFSLLKKAQEALKNCRMAAYSACAGDSHRGPWPFLDCIINISREMDEEIGLYLYGPTKGNEG